MIFTESQTVFVTNIFFENFKICVSLLYLKTKEIYKIAIFKYEEFKYTHELML